MGEEVKVNDAAFALIREFEGFKAEAYLDELAKPPVWTIGYGTTAAAGVGIVPRPGMVISREQAETYLRMAVDKFAAEIRPHITREINENQFGAFVSLAYNIGPGAFRKSSALRKFNAGDIEGAANAILLWEKAGGKVLRGLQRRRRAERDLFLTAAPVPAPEAEGWLAALLRALAAMFGRKA
jgi:lysozyme